MQKIVFVGIILIIGLFSLQFSLASFYTQSFKSEDKVNTPVQTTNVHEGYLGSYCRIVHIGSGDSIVVIQLSETSAL